MSKIKQADFVGFTPVASVSESNSAAILDRVRDLTLVTVPQVTQMLHTLLRCHPEYRLITSGKEVVGFLAGSERYDNRDFYVVVKDGTIRYFDTANCLDNV